MTIKCILNSRTDLYTDSWTKYAKAQEGERTEEEDDISVEAALSNYSVLSLSVTDSAYSNQSQALLATTTLPCKHIGSQYHP